MPSFNYIIIYDAATNPVAITSQDFDGGAADHVSPIVRIRYPVQLTPAAPSDLSTTTEDPGDVGAFDTPIIRARHPIDPQITPDIATISEDFLGVPDDYRVPIVRVRYPLEPQAPQDLFTAAEDFLGLPESYEAPIIRARKPVSPPPAFDLPQEAVDTEGTLNDESPQIIRSRQPLEDLATQDLFTDIEDFLGLPTDHDAPIIRARQPTEPAPAFDLLQEPVDTEGAPEDFRAPLIPARFLFQSVGIPSDVSVTSEDFLGGATEHATPLVVRPFAVASPNPMSGVLFSDPVVPPVPPVPGTPSRFGTPEVIVVAQRFLGGEQTILGTRFGIPRVRQGARFGAPRIQTNVARFGGVRLQDVT